MIAITADSSLKALLGNLKDVAQVRDAEGEIIGYLAPPQKAVPLLRDLVESVFDPAESARKAANQQTGVPLEEVVTRLQAME